MVMMVFAAAATSAGDLTLLAPALSARVRLEVFTSKATTCRPDLTRLAAMWPPCALHNMYTVLAKHNYMSLAITADLISSAARCVPHYMEPGGVLDMVLSPCMCMRALWIWFGKIWFFGMSIKGGRKGRRFFTMFPRPINPIGSAKLVDIMRTPNGRAMLLNKPCCTIAIGQGCVCPSHGGKNSRERNFAELGQAKRSILR
jgi:hypothetical protein